MRAAALPLDRWLVRGGACVCGGGYGGFNEQRN